MSKKEDTKAKDAENKADAEKKAAAENATTDKAPTTPNVETEAELQAKADATAEKIKEVNQTPGQEDEIEKALIEEAPEEFVEDPELAEKLPEDVSVGPDNTVSDAAGKTIYAPPGSHNAAMNGVQQDKSGHFTSANKVNSDRSGVRP